MVEYTNVLLDYEGGIEILFSRPSGTTFSYSNDVIEYVRRRDVKTVPHVSSAGAREISFQMETAASPTLERQLDYFRRSGKSLLLFLPLSNFASEIVIKDVELTEQVQTTQKFTISAYCFGVEGQAYLASDPIAILSADAALVSDSDALGGYAAKCLSNTDNLFFSTVADNVYMPAGDYTVIARARSQNSVTDGMVVGALTTYGVTIASNVVTVSTSGYGYYAALGAVPTAQYGNTVNTLAQQWGTESNNVYIDLVAYVQASGLITI